MNQDNASASGFHGKLASAAGPITSVGANLSNLNGRLHTLESNLIRLMNQIQPAPQSVEVPANDKPNPYLLPLSNEALSTLSRVEQHVQTITDLLHPGAQ